MMVCVILTKAEEEAAIMKSSRLFNFQKIRVYLEIIVLPKIFPAQLLTQQFVIYALLICRYQTDEP